MIDSYDMRLMTEVTQ